MTLCPASLFKPLALVLAFIAAARVLAAPVPPAMAVAMTGGEMAVTIDLPWTSIDDDSDATAATGSSIWLRVIVRLNVDRGFSAWLAATSFERTDPSTETNR